LSIAFSNFAHFLLALIPLFLVMVVVGHPISRTILLLPLILVPLFCLSLGVAMIFAVANVFFDDTRHIVGVFLQALYYLSPILYGREHLPERLLQWLNLNPMFHIVELVRQIFYYSTYFDWSTYFA